MVTTFTHRLLPPRIIYSTLFFSALDIFVFDEAAVQKVFTWWKPERDGQEENKLCFGRCWEKLPKVALIHPIHPRAVCMQYMPCTQTSTNACHKCTAGHLLWRMKICGGDLCVKEDLWRRVAEFCNLSTYARRSIVDPRGKREEMEEMFQQIPKYFDWTDLSGADRKPYETYEIKQSFEFGCN